MDGRIYPSAKHIDAASQTGRREQEKASRIQHSPFCEPERERGRRKSKRAVIRFHLKY